MKTRSVKNLLIAAVNLIVLSTLLALWTDKLELLFNYLVRPIEFLKIIGATVLSIIAMRLFRRLKAPIGLTLLISAYLYINYTQKIISNRILYGQCRKQMAARIINPDGLTNGTVAEALTIDEYREIAKITKFPDLSTKACNIQYIYQFDGFLPDYTFTLIYDLPKEIKVDTFAHREGDFSKYQSVKAEGLINRVTYTQEDQ